MGVLRWVWKVFVMYSAGYWAGGLMVFFIPQYVHFMLAIQLENGFEKFMHLAFLVTSLASVIVYEIKERNRD